MNFERINFSSNLILLSFLVAFHSGEGLVSKHLAPYFDLTRQSLISSVLTRLSKNDEKNLHAIQCYDSDDDAWPYGMNTK